MLQHVVVSLKLHWDSYVFQMKPTRCTLILSIFISTSLHVSGNCAHHQEDLLYLCDTGIFHSVWVAVWSADQDRIKGRAHANTVMNRRVS